MGNKMKIEKSKILNNNENEKEKQKETKRKNASWQLFDLKLTNNNRKLNEWVTYCEVIYPLTLKLCLP